MWDARSAVAQSLLHSTRGCCSRLPPHAVAAARECHCMHILLQEHGVNGQDLLCMTEEDMEDGRFKFPKNVQRKVGRLGWCSFDPMSRVGRQCQPNHLDGPLRQRLQRCFFTFAPAVLH